MAITLTEIQERLKKIDECLLLEVLDINSEDIVHRFVDKIEDQFDILSIDYEEDIE